MEKSLLMNEKHDKRDNEINNVKEMLMKKDIETSILKRRMTILEDKMTRVKRHRRGRKNCSESSSKVLSSN